MTPEEAGIDEARESLPQRLAPAIPALVLVIIAAHQIYLAQIHDLDPWKGGGFGMFSTSEGAGSRHTHVFVTQASGEREIDLPEDLEDLDERLAALPSDRRLGEFARELSATIRVEHPDHTAVRVEVWHTRYDVDDLTPETFLIRDFSSEAVDGDAG
jgi:hypothetical protein